MFGIDVTSNYVRQFVAIPDTQIAWFSTLPGAWLARSVDVIYASCSPFSSAISACVIKLVSGKPLVVDFRDVWETSPHRNPLAIQRLAVRRLERMVVAICDRLIVNTTAALQLYEARYPWAKEKLRAIPNGYDALIPVIRKGTPERFTIMHVGSFYEGRHPGNLLEALAGLQGLPIDFVQVGGAHPMLEHFASRVRIKTTGVVSHPEAVKLMSQASLLYLRQAIEDGVTQRAIAAKTYEYLATGLPILAEVPFGVNAKMVERYAKTAYIVTEENPEVLRRMVEQAFCARKELRPDIDPEFVAEFDRVNLTARLAAVFSEVTAEAGGRGAR
jgi:glycosyltransferase involved in cell wall biosynthesis